MPRSLRSQKQQTRLSFQPLPSSSPSKQGYSSAVRSRLAKVRFQGSQTVREVGTVNSKDGFSSLPSPEPSSQVFAADQTSSSPSTGPLTSPALPALPHTDDPVTRLDPGEYHEDEDEDEDEIPIPSSKRRRLSERLTTSRIDDRSSPRRSHRLTQHTSPLSNRTRGDDTTISHMQATLRSRDSRNKTTRELSSPLRRISSIASAETSGDDEDIIVTKPTQRRRATKPAVEDPFIVADDSITYISSDESDIPNKTIKSRQISRNRRDDFVVSNDEVEYQTSDNENQQVKKSAELPRKKSRAQKKKSAREQAELEEDLLDLQDSESEIDENLGRTRGGPVNTQREKSKEHFARLKRQRAGERVTRIIDSDEEEYNEEDNEQNYVDIDTIGNDNDDATSDTFSQHSLIGAPDPHHNLSTHEMQEDEDDFIVEDAGTNLGRHGRPHPDIPLQFTSFASSKPRELFIHIIEWMVKNKISPAFLRDDDVFTMTFSRIDDQVKAQAGSRLISSAWGATFKYAILARPGMKVNALPGLDEDNIRTCDACNRTNHPARYDFVFDGQPYNKDTLEPIDEDDEDDADSEDSQEESHQASKAEYDEQGHLLAPASQHFYLGRFCAANAEMGHKLSHWKYHLNEQVLIYLEEQGVLSPEAIVARERLNKKKREKEAENIVDMMEATGEVAKLWQGFQDDLEDARFGMEDHHGMNRGGRGKARIGSVRVQRADGRIGEYGEGGKYKEVARNESDSEGG